MCIVGGPLSQLKLIIPLRCLEKRFEGMFASASYRLHEGDYRNYSNRTVDPI